MGTQPDTHTVRHTDARLELHAEKHTNKTCARTHIHASADGRTNARTSAAPGGACWHTLSYLMMLYASTSASKIMQCLPKEACLEFFRLHISHGNERIVGEITPRRNTPVTCFPIMRRNTAKGSALLTGWCKLLVLTPPLESSVGRERERNKKKREREEGGGIGTPKHDMRIGKQNEK